MNYLVYYRLRKDIQDISPADAAKVWPEKYRVKASNATRAISTTVNELKASGTISSKAEIVIAEVKVVP